MHLTTLGQQTGVVPERLKVVGGPAVKKVLERVPGCTRPGNVGPGDSLISYFLLPI
jgi:hypothetical protein